MKENHKAIVYLGGFDLPNGNAAAQRVVANAKLFRDLGYQVMLIGLSRNKSNINKRFIYEGFQCINLKYPKSVVGWLNYITAYNQYMPFIKEMRPQLVIAYNHPAIALRRLTNYCHKNGIKILADCTEWYEAHGNYFFRKIKSWDSNWRMFKVHCDMDGIISISKYLYDFYINRGVHTLQLPPLVDKQEMKWHQKLRGDDEKIRLVFAGSIGGGYKERLDIIVDALMRIETKLSEAFVLDIIGINKEQFKCIYTNWEGKTFPSFIQFHGRIDHEEAIRLLQESDYQIFLRDNSLSNQAGFPTKFVEAISANSLVLTNPTSNISDYLREGINGYLLDTSNSDKLTDSLMIPLSLDKKNIMEKRNKMNCSEFDYRNFISAMRRFIDEL